MPDDSRDGRLGDARRELELLHNAHHKLASRAEIPYKFQASSTAEAGSRKRHQ
jgi:hypothetical protein